MTLREILRNKGHKILCIGPGETLEDVVESLNRNNCGSLVVSENEQMIGIITERDVLRALARGCGTIRETKVSECMTRDVVIGRPDDSLADAMGLMTQRRVRHLPIMEDKKMIGLVSIGDVVKAELDSLSLENHYLKTYINGEYEGLTLSSLSSPRPR